MMLDMRIQMLVLLAAMIRTNPVIQDSKRLVSGRCTQIVALQSVTLQSHLKRCTPTLAILSESRNTMNVNESLTCFRVWFLPKYHTQTLTQVKSDVLMANNLGTT